MENITQILESVLHAAVEPSDSPAARTMPLFLREVFDAQVWKVEGVDILFACPRKAMSFSALQKQWRQLEHYTKIPCALCLEETTRYAKDRLIQLGIPFLLGKDNLYLPCLGVALRKKRAAAPLHISGFSPAAQKMVLLAIYEKWQWVSSREISEKLGMSRMTASRNLLELESLGLPLVKTSRGAKYFSFQGSSRQLFDMCNGFFANPVEKVYYLEEIPRGAECLGGRSAVSRYSVLPDSACRTYALTRQECRQIGLSNYAQCDREDAVCAVHVVRYKIGAEKAIDPISAVLSVWETEHPDAREKAALMKMLNDHLRN